jgi:YbbR domain-containing protein
VIPDVTVTPRVAHITQPVSLLGGFKNVVVKVVTTGKVEEGYRLTNISVSPLTVTLFSDDPQLIEDIPGFVETLPVDLTGLQDYYETVVSLNLPEGAGADQHRADRGQPNTDRARGSDWASSRPGGCDISGDSRYYRGGPAQYP